MKLIALAAALTLASPALAQTAPAAMNTASQPGGYAPATMWANGAPQPGDRVVFHANPLTPSEAFPPPAPRAHYPLCTNGQADECIQRGSR
ncbi:hypothetical protein [Sphingomonas sp. R1]|uniref:hypothetical protein n=1 Tax=Sphingomonas sp. R1 TaxID=399176 RepID=UPI0022252C0C|nr:hypothetical protein [Sphingomonas sp. R1]UYY77266.1 hypothetical protein OIM94_17505 [Sphingomonas sp. R1]